MLVETTGINVKEYTGVTYVPRSRKNIRRYGYDQSRIMAEEISKIYNIPLLELLGRRKGRDQKLLSIKDRFRTSKEKYEPRNIPEEKYKKILLLDDICTTGATIKACAEILRKNSANHVVPLVIAKTMPFE